MSTHRFRCPKTSTTYSMKHGILCALLLIAHCTADDTAVAQLILSTVGQTTLNHLGWGSTQKAVLAALSDIKRNKHSCELFCGTAGVSTALAKHKFKTRKFDLKIGGFLHDMTTVEGQSSTLLAVLSLVEHGILWVGFPCTTFVWIGRRVMKRTKLDPFGDVSREDICQDRHFFRIRRVHRLQRYM